MNDFSPIIEYISRYVDLDANETEQFKSFLKVTKVRKKQFIVQPGFVCKHKSYVVKGAFRSYLVDNEGKEHTLAFAIEDWWISDYSSLIYQEPATLFVEALEDSVVLQIDYQTEQKLKASNHKIETFFRIGAERTAAYHQRRIIKALTQTAHERYNDFMETYPNVIQRVPLYVLASYLGMTRQFLSKIRNERFGTNE